MKVKVHYYHGWWKDTFDIRKAYIARWQVRLGPWTFYLGRHSIEERQEMDKKDFGITQ